MNITVVGAAGRLGQRVAEEASRRGHQVTGLARHPQRIAKPELVSRIAAGDGRDRDTIADAVAGADAVVIKVAGGTGNDPHQAADVTRTVIAAMHDHDVHRLVITSAYPIVAVRPRAVMWILRKALATPYADTPKPSGSPPPATWTGPSPGSTASPTTAPSAPRTSHPACWTEPPACPGPTQPPCWSTSLKPATMPAKPSTSAATTVLGEDKSPEHAAANPARHTAARARPTREILTPLRRNAPVAGPGILPGRRTHRPPQRDHAYTANVTVRRLGFAGTGAGVDMSNPATGRLIAHCSSAGCGRARRCSSVLGSRHYVVRTGSW